MGDDTIYTMQENAERTAYLAAVETPSTSQKIRSKIDELDELLQREAPGLGMVQPPARRPQFAPGIDDYQDWTQSKMPPLAQTQVIGQAFLSSLLGLSGEVGELLDLIKKDVCHGVPLDRDKLRKEFGDVVFYLSALANYYQLPMSEICETNRQKLEERYPNGFVPGGGRRESSGGGGGGGGVGGASFSPIQAFGGGGDGWNSRWSSASSAQCPAIGTDGSRCCLPTNHVEGYHRSSGEGARSRCPVRDSSGVWCELKEWHDGVHAAPEARSAAIAEPRRGERK